MEQVEFLRPLRSEIKHDCFEFSTYADSFVTNEPVNVFEKIHGTQIVIIFHKDCTLQISSKGLFQKGLCLKESKNNFYWKAFSSSKIEEFILQFLIGKEVILFGEAIPIQKGFNYDLDSNKPTVLLFRMILEGKEIPFNILDLVYPELSKLWVPLLESVSFDKEVLIKLGRNLKSSLLDLNQIAEGIVISPIVPRQANDGSYLFLKVISNSYAQVEDPEAIS